VTSRNVSPVLVGREAEMQVMTEAFAEAAEGTPGLLLLDGEAGAGKSRLVSEFSGAGAGAGPGAGAGRGMR